MRYWHVTLLLLLLAHSCEILLANSTSFDHLSTSKVLRVDNYLTAFVWKEHFEYVRNQGDIFNMFTSTASTKTSSLPQVKIAIVGTRKSTIKHLWSNILQFKNISKSTVENFESIVLGSCQFMNIFEDYDIIISEPYEFYTKLKGSRVLGQKKTKSEFLDSSDFIPIPIFPISVIQSDSLNVSTTFEWLNSSSVCSEQNYDKKFHSIGQFETQWLDVYYNLGKIRQSDIDFLSWVNGFQIETLSPTEMQSYLENLRIEKHIPVSNITLSDYLSNLLHSNCTYCTNLYCTPLTFVDSDYWIIPVSILIIIYYAILFGTKSFQLPAIKRRLLTPYTPIVCVFFEAMEMYALDSYCAKVRLTILGTVMNWIVLICIFTVIRFYYLRNLYHTMALSTTSVEINSIRKRKVLASVWFGIVFTGLISFVVSLVVSLPYLANIFIVFHFDDFDEFAVTNLLVGLYILAGCIIGIVTVLVDMIFNWKKIKQRGLKHFLIFDDPFMFRVDLVLFIVIVILIIIASIPKNQIHVDLFFRFLIYFTFTFVAGGVVIIKSMIEKWMARNKDYESNFVQYLKNPEFQELIKKYCLKEMSSENFVIYMDLMKVEKQGKSSTLDLETLQKFESDYFHADSMYEVNISHASKSKFYQVLNRAKKDDLPTVGDLIEALLTDVISNLYDTFSRLERTNEFKVWLDIYDIQLKNLLL